MKNLYYSLFVSCMLICCSSGPDEIIPKLCGNGVVDPGEACDDNNREQGDGCSVCQIDAGYECDGAPSVCVNINDCALRPCKNGSLCVDGNEAFTCDCTGTTFTGVVCDEPTDETPAFVNCRGSVDEIADGYCDESNNNEACGFDGGDCCRSTCDDADYTCGGFTRVDGAILVGDLYNCVDPGACENSDEPCECAPGCLDEFIGDGMCHEECWNSACNWDYSDLGAADCACADVGHHEDCGGMCFDDSYLSWQGDGYCDDRRYGLDLVCEVWNFDNGDCEGSEPWEPPAECDFNQIADGFFDVQNNVEVCDYDGGDCCGSTCFSNVYPCSPDLNLYECLDPWACENDGGCTCECDVSWLGDGACDTPCYIIECNWDGAALGASDCSCGEVGMEVDCDGTCFLNFFSAWTGDGYCDDGTYGLNFKCALFNYDDGDCNEI